MSASIPIMPAASELPIGLRQARLPSEPDTDFVNISRMLLPSPIVHQGGPIEQWQQALPTEEEVFVRHSVRRRVREFTAGRNCARAALRRLGYDNVVIPMGPRREPLWPAGVIGSISHGAGYCLAAVCSRNQLAGIGVDIEPAVPLSANVMQLVCTSDELRWCESQGELAGLLAKFHFSAKEAIFKCLYPVFHAELEFQEVRLDISLHEESFTAEVAAASLGADGDVIVRGRMECTADVIVTSAVLHDDDMDFLPLGSSLPAGLADQLASRCGFRD